MIGADPSAGLGLVSVGSEDCDLEAWDKSWTGFEEFSVLIV